VETPAHSIEAMRQQLAELEQQRAELERTLAARHEAAKGDIALQARELILSNGYDVEEILALVAGSAGRQRRGAAQPSTRKTGYYVDPADPTNTYVRGATPGWMKDRMLEQGLNPGSKEDRDGFKANYLKRVG
jgi:DNA-binding protein H-NS